MDLQAFGQTLSDLMKRTRVTRPALAQQMNVSVALIDKWKSTSADKRQHRRPTYEQFRQLAARFAPYLDPPAAQQWATQAGYALQESDLAAIFPPVFYPDPSSPDMSVTYNRLGPLPTHRLFGIETAKAKMLQVLNHQSDYWLLALDGIGGIGKTALANVLAREMLGAQRFYDVAWISAKQEEFLPGRGLQPVRRPALQPNGLADELLAQLAPALSVTCPSQEKAAILMRWFKTCPYLVVIDNLETAPDYEVLLDPLRRWANPTKFLLTSRHSLGQYTDIYSYTLTELSQTDTLEFLKYQGEMQNIPALVQAGERALIAIYRVVGGNPLALKLVAGQIRFTGLQQVLAGLERARGKSVDQLYQYIYRQIWESLTETARRVLLFAPLAQNGAWQDLERLSDVRDELLCQALDQLLTRSLIEAAGSLNQPRYRIHSLTKTFLHTEIFYRWKPA